MGWLQTKCGGTDPKSAVAANYDEATDSFDDDFIRAGRTKAKRAVRKLHRDDPTQPKRVSVEQLDAIVEAHYRTALETPGAELAVMCSLINPLTDE
jgi:hypothetical protein